MAACAQVQVSRQTAYVLRRRDAAFARGWAAALVLARHHAEDVLASRAIHGVEEDVWYHGERIATRRRFDARLLLAHLARLDRLAGDTDAADDAARFDELVAIVGGLRPHADMFAGAGSGGDPVLPMERADYGALAVDLAGQMQEADPAWLAVMLPPHDDDPEADDWDYGEDDDEEWDDLDDDEDDDPDAAERAARREAAYAAAWAAGFNFDKAEAGAWAEWDAWQRAARAFVDDGTAAIDLTGGDGLAGVLDSARNVARDCPTADAEGQDADRAGPDGSGPLEYKSLEMPGLHRVRCVNLERVETAPERLTALSRPRRRWYAARVAAPSGGGSAGKGQLTMGMQPRFRSGLRAGLAGAAALASAFAPQLAQAAGGSVAMMADLSGAQVVGQNADSDGSGRFVASLDVKTRQLCYELEVRLIGPANAASIYAGRTGRAAAAGLVSLTPPDARGRSKGCVAVSKQAAKALSADPSVAHVSVHNPLYPAGALRGQLAAGGPGLSAEQGAAEAQAAGSPTSRAESGYSGPVTVGT